MKSLLRPRFKAHFHVEVMEPDHVVLLTEESHHILSGQAYVHLAPLLDGRHSAADIVRQLDGKISPPEIYYALDQAAQGGFLIEGEDDPQVLPAESIFWDALNVATPTAQQRLAELRVAVCAVGDAEAAPLEAALEALNVMHTGSNGDLTVVVTDDYLRVALESVNAAHLEMERPWLTVKLVGSMVWIGPLFVPGSTGCWQCLAQRLRANRQMETYLLERSGRSEPFNTSIPALSATLEIGAQLAATEILKWLLTGRNDNLAGHLITLDLIASRLEKHRLVKRPQCPACGDPAFQASKGPDRPVLLTSSPKRYREDGGHRSSFPEETLARYGHHVSPITGVINSLHSRTEDHDSLTHNVVAVHYFPMFKDDVNVLRKNMRGRSGGKGMSETQAKVSALGEAMERYSGVWWGDETVVRGSSIDLGARAIDLKGCLGFSDDQYANREAWNRSIKTPHQVVPHPPDPSMVVDWTPVWSLTKRETRYIPSAYCYFGHPELDQLFCLADTNGCAAGNTLEEAVLQGFLELIERDAVAIWWYNRVKRPAVDVNTFDIPYFHDLRDYYQRYNRSLWVLDLTADLAVPVFAAFSARLDSDVEDLIFGFGAHLDPKIGIIRSLTELNQSYPFVAEQTSDGRTNYLADDAEMLHWFQTATRGSESYVVPDVKVAATTRPDYPTAQNEDILDDIRDLVRRVQGAGLETFVLDQTRPDVAMPACRVIVPGLRHYWRRLGPGRLYDVPSKMGWLDQPLREVDLNPYSISF